MFYTMSNLSIQVQGLSSTKIVGGAGGGGWGKVLKKCQTPWSADGEI